MENQTAAPAETAGNELQKETGNTSDRKNTAQKKTANAETTASAETPAEPAAKEQIPAVTPDPQSGKATGPLEQLSLYDDAAMALAEDTALPPDEFKQKIGQTAPVKETATAAVAKVKELEKTGQKGKAERKKAVTPEGRSQSDIIQPTTRITGEIAKIDAREKERGALFERRVKLETLKRLQTEERIKGYKDVIARYRGSKDPAEQGQLRGMELEKKELEESIYGRGFRFRKLFEKLGTRFESKADPLKKVSEDDTPSRPVKQNTGVRKQLIKSRFIRMLVKADQRINRGDYNFSMTESKDLGNGRIMDYKVLFGPGRSKNEKVSIDRIEASYFDKNDPSASHTRSFDFRKGENYTKQQMATLMSGGAVYQEKSSRLGISTGPRWVSVDFNDTKNGQYRMRTSPAENRAFYQAKLEALPGFTDYQQDKLQHMLGSLLNGNKEAACLKINGKKANVILQMDIRNDKVGITNSRGKPVVLSTSGKIIDINSRRQMQQQQFSQGKQRKAGLKVI